MNILHIIFNIDLYDPRKKKPFRSDLPDDILANFIEVPSSLQFKSLLNFLNEDINCFIWIHIAKSAEKDFSGEQIDYVNDASRFLKEYGIDFNEVTRDGEYAKSNNIIYSNNMPLVLENSTSYKIRELKESISPKPNQNRENRTTRPRLIDSFKRDVLVFNKEFQKYQDFLSSKINISSSSWREIFNGTIEAEIVNQLFQNPFWHFDNKVLNNFLNVESKKNVLSESEFEVESGINYNKDQLHWEIDFSFFNQVSNRFEENGDNYIDKVIIATRLFIIHETIHKHHNLDNKTVLGIGNFPRIVEYLDFQADSIAIILEILFKVHQNGGIEKCDSKFMVNSFLETIRIAIETTFSFNPIENHEIQVRRVNRYSIWLYIYNKLENLDKLNPSSLDTLISIVKIMSKKPMIEISGPKIISKENRTFYDLAQIKHVEEIAWINSENRLNRAGKTSNFDFQNLYEGLENSDFEMTNAFFQKLISGHKTLF